MFVLSRDQTQTLRVPKIAVLRLELAVSGLETVLAPELDVSRRELAVSVTKIFIHTSIVVFSLVCLAS